MPAEQLVLRYDPGTSFAAADFLIADSNRAAHGWLERYPDWPAPALVLHGPHGAGKSHLARMFAARTGGSLLDPQTLPAPGERPDRGPLILDPAPPVADEPALLHLYQWVAERGRHLLLTARDPVPLWGLRLKDLESRLQVTPAVELGLPDDDLLAAILVKLFSDRQVEVESGVVALLVRRMERSYAAARTLVDRLDGLSMRDKRRITPAMARHVLMTTTMGGEEFDGSRDQG